MSFSNELTAKTNKQKKKTDRVFLHLNLTKPTLDTEGVSNIRDYCEPTIICQLKRNVNSLSAEEHFGNSIVD